MQGEEREEEEEAEEEGEEESEGFIVTVVVVAEFGLVEFLFPTPLFDFAGSFCLFVLDGLMSWVCSASSSTSRSESESEEEREGGTGTRKVSLVVEKEGDLIVVGESERAEVRAACRNWLKKLKFYNARQLKTIVDCDRSLKLMLVQRTNEGRTFLVEK